MRKERPHLCRRAMAGLLLGGLVMLGGCQDVEKGRYSAPSDPTLADESPVALVPYSAEGDAMAISGTLVLEEGCLYMRNGDERMLALFPWPGTRWNPQQRSLTVFDGLTVRVGQSLSAGGGVVGDNPDGARDRPLAEARAAEVQGMMVIPRPRCDTSGPVAILYFGRNPELSPSRNPQSDGARRETSADGSAAARPSNTPEQ